MTNASKRVVVIGGGFAGLSVVKSLSRESNVQVTLIDRRNHHLFQPLLYQVAMAGLSPADIAAPLRSIVSRQKNTQVVYGRVTNVDLERKVLSATFGELAFDYLIIACGAQHSYFGHNEWEQHAPGLKTIEQATEIRRRVLRAFERAELSDDPDERRRLMTFVVVGGGPTGVELAGAIGEMSRFTLSRDFRRIDSKQARIILVEAGPRILPMFSEKSSSRAMRDLEYLGVQTWTNSKVTRIDARGVMVSGDQIHAGTVLWAAGVQATELPMTPAVPRDRSGRLTVNSDLSLPNHPHIFAAGDICHFVTEAGKALPGLAPVAMQQGKHVAKNIIADLSDKPRKEFAYRDKGQMATIGRTRAVAETGKFRLSGLIAWLAWLFVHIYYLNGFRNRFFVVLNWGWSFLTFKRGSRLILRKSWRFYDNSDSVHSAPKISSKNNEAE
ncbi:MAG: NAD(P)/FAD-dependent oxidoreductase [Pirellulaceae bacterium]